MLTTTSLSIIRMSLLGLAGLVSLTYAALAIILQTPAPMPFWIPGTIGVLAALGIALSMLMAGKARAEQAVDEAYVHDNLRSFRFSYWFALALYPAFAGPLMLELVSWHVAYAAMGTLTAAGYLLSFVWFDLKGRL